MIYIAEKCPKDRLGQWKIKIKTFTNVENVSRSFYKLDLALDN